MVVSLGGELAFASTMRGRRGRVHVLLLLRMLWDELLSVRVWSVHHAWGGGRRLPCQDGRGGLLGREVVACSLLRCEGEVVKMRVFAAVARCACAG